MIICAPEAFRSAVFQLAFRMRHLIECVERTHTHTHTVSLIPANLVSHQYVCSVQVSAIDFFLLQFDAILSERPTASRPPSLLSFIMSLFLLLSRQIFSSLLVFLSSNPDLSSGPLRFSINMLLASSCEVLKIQRMFSTFCTCL